MELSRSNDNCFGNGKSIFVNTEQLEKALYPMLVHFGKLAVIKE